MVLGHDRRPKTHRDVRMKLVVRTYNKAWPGLDAGKTSLVCFSMARQQQQQQVSEMMETNEGEREDTPMIDALARGTTDMRKLYALRAGQLKASA